MCSDKPSQKHGQISTSHYNLFPTFRQLGSLHLTSMSELKNILAQLLYLMCWCIMGLISKVQNTGATLGSLQVAVYCSATFSSYDKTP